MLTVSAAHLQHLNTTPCKMYGFQAAHHLQECLSSFRRALSGSTTSIANNIDAIVGTSLLLVVHGFATPKFGPKRALSDSLLQHSNGIFDIIRRTRRLKTSEAFEKMCTPALLPPVFPTAGPALDLVSMIKSNSPSTAPSKRTERIYLAVVQSLTLILEAVSNRRKLGNTPPDSLLFYLVQWLSLLPQEFVILIDEFDERALVIMSHYYAIVGFILSRLNHGWWWMRTRPVYMVTHIHTLLGPQWDIWMQWPLQIP